MNAILIANDLAEIAAESLFADGQVHSVFDHAVNCTFDENGWMTLLTDEAAIGPMGLIVKSPSLKILRLQPGMKMEIGYGRISIKEAGLELKLSGLRTWNPHAEEIAEPVDPTVKNERLEKLEKWILKNGNMAGVANVIEYLELPDRIRKLQPETELNVFGQFALERIQAFTAVLVDNDAERIREKVRGIIGFGPGLTPSGDDFLAGVGASMIYLKSYFKLNKEAFMLPLQLIADESSGRTTRVSAEMLKNLSKGLMPKRFMDLQTALLGKSGPDLKPVLFELDRMGETSGTDHALGVFVAHCVLTSENVRRKLG